MKDFNNYKKPFYLSGLGIALLCALLLGRYMANDFANRRAYDKTKAAVSTMQTKISELSPEEYAKAQALRNQAFGIIYKHLDDYDKEKFINLINRGVQSPEMLEENNELLKKARRGCSPEENSVIDKFSKLTSGLSGVE